MFTLNTTWQYLTSKFYFIPFNIFPHTSLIFVRTLSSCFFRYFLVFIRTLPLCFHGYFPCVYLDTFFVFSRTLSSYFPGHFLCVFLDTFFVFSRTLPLCFPGHFLRVFRDTSFVFSLELFTFPGTSFLFSWELYKYFSVLPKYTLPQESFDFYVYSYIFVSLFSYITFYLWFVFALSF